MSQVVKMRHLAMLKNPSTNFLDPNLDAGDFQKLTSSFLPTDTFWQNFHEDPISSFFSYVALLI